MRPSCSGRLAVMLVVCAILSGCAQTSRSSRTGPVSRGPAATILVPTVDSEIAAANEDLSRGDIGSAERHLRLGLTASDTVSEKLKVNEMLATVYELEGKLVQSEVCWRECMALSLGSSGQLCDATIDFMRNRARILRRLGDAVQVRLIDDEIEAYKFDKARRAEEGPDELPANASPGTAIDVTKKSQPCYTFQRISICPKCHTAAGCVPVIYGAPTEDMIEQEAKGSIRIGGMVLQPGENYYCKLCRVNW